MTTFVRPRIVLGHTVRLPLLIVAFAVLGVSVALVASTAAPWWIIPLGLLGPDLTFFAGIGDHSAGPERMPRRAVPFYNVAHHPLAACAGVVVAASLAEPTATALAVLWLAHIVWDRAVGYGLRNPDGTMRQAVAPKLS